ncbi:MAG: DUF2812 domain-containing protein [Acetatifactor sp.]|nr:DUF2812 domain-containing protein [Acetatifactor sp.]
MSNSIMKMRFFTIADFKEEEKWLQKMHRGGLKLVNMRPPCFFYFERCEPEDVVYQLDFRNRRDGDGVEYRQMFRDCGWEYVSTCMSFHYFRKPVSQMEGEEEIFSDNVSRIDLLGRIWKWRMMPIFVIFFGCILPQIHQGIVGSNPIDVFFWMFFVMLFIYMGLIFYVGIKFFRMKRSLRQSC